MVFWGDATELGTSTSRALPYRITTPTSTTPTSTDFYDMKAWIAAPATAALVYRAWSRNSLTPLGIVVAAMTAMVHAIHPWSTPFALLVVFFLAGTTVTKVIYSRLDTYNLPF